MKKILFLLIFLSFEVFARTGYMAPVIVGGVVAGGIVGTQYSIYQALIHNELKNWTRPETGTTVRLEKQCGIQAEFHLAGNHRNNYLLLGIANSSSGILAVKSRDIKFIYDQKKDRFPGFTQEVSDSKIAPGWWQIAWIPFPSKNEFQGVDKIQVEVPVWNETTNSTCLIRTSFDRTNNIKLEDQSYSALEILFDGGASLAQSGDIKELGKPHGYFSFEFNFYFRPNHGAGMVFSNELDFEGSDNRKIINEFDGGRGYSANISYFGLQYIYRHFFSQNVFMTFAPSLGVQFVEDMEENDINNRESSTDLAFSEKLMLNWRFHQWLTPTNEVMDFVTGVGIVHNWSVSTEVNGQDLDGSRLSAIARFGFGF